MKMFLEEENRMLKDMVDKIKTTGANVVICQKGIDDIAKHYLAKSSILTVRRVKESDMTRLARELPRLSSEQYSYLSVWWI